MGECVLLTPLQLLQNKNIYKSANFTLLYDERTRLLSNCTRK